MSDLLVIGVVVAAHSLNGEVRVKIETDFPERFDTGNRVQLRQNGKTRDHVIDFSREHKGMALVKLHGIDDRDAAEKLRGAEFVIKRDDVKPLPSGSWYIFQLEGLEVYTRSGAYLGVLTEVLHPGGNDVYVVKKDTREILLPALKKVIVDVDLASKRMTVDPLEDYEDAD